MCRYFCTHEFEIIKLIFNIYWFYICACNYKIICNIRILPSSIELREYNCEPQSSPPHQEPIKILVIYN